MKTIAVILAAGSGSRLGAEKPKQFLEVEGRLIIEYSLDAFEACEAVDEICIVVADGYAETVSEICRRSGYRKVTNIINGGSDRFSSSLNAVKCLNQESPDTIIMFHDAVRPLVTPALIKRCLEAMQDREAVAVGSPLTDTIWLVGSGKDIAGIPPRKDFFNAQTPQCFRKEDLTVAYNRATNDPGHFTPTDDCGVIFRYRPTCRIHVIENTSPNLKVTYKEDLSILASILKSRKDADKAQTIQG